MQLFKTNTCWCVHSMQKNGLSLHRRPSFRQKLPGDFEEKLVAFQWHVDIKRWTITSSAKQQTQTANQHTLIGCQIMSMILGQHLLLLKHISHLFIRKYVSKHHVGISVDGRMLLPYGILKFNGTKLLPYMILKWKATRKEQICGRKTVRCQPKGWMINELIHNKYIGKNHWSQLRFLLLVYGGFFP